MREDGFMAMLIAFTTIGMLALDIAIAVFIGSFPSFLVIVGVELLTAVGLLWKYKDKVID